MSELESIDDHLARLKWRLAHGGMSYEDAVAVDELVTIVTEIRSRLASHFETDHCVPCRVLPRTAFEIYIRSGFSFQSKA